MNYKAKTYYSPGGTLYTAIYDPDGDAYNGTSFVSFDGDHSTFGLSLTEDSNRTRYYEYDAGEVFDRGTYVEEYWLQSGGSPDRSADTLIGAMERPWIFDRDYAPCYLEWYTTPASYEYTYTLTDGDGNAVSDAYLWITPTSSGNLVLENRTTDASGQVTFHVGAGDIWVHKHHDDYVFSQNPEKVTIASSSPSAEDLEIEAFYRHSGATLYSLLFDSSGDCYNGTSFASFDGTQGNFDIALSEGGTKTHRYTATVSRGDLGFGTYEAEVWLQKGGSPSRGDDELLGSINVSWLGDYGLDKSRLRMGTRRGTTQYTYTVTTSGGKAVPSADVLVTLDSAGAKPIAFGSANYKGEVVFFLPAGTYYFWPHHPGHNFDTPYTETVS